MVNILMLRPAGYAKTAQEIEKMHVITGITGQALRPTPAAAIHSALTCFGNKYPLQLTPELLWQKSVCA